MPDRKMNQVLLVDDDPLVLEIYDSVLSASGYACTAVTSPESALEQLNSMPDCAVLVTDLQMPALNGIDLMRAIRERFPERGWLQLVVITGIATLESAIDSLRLDAMEYLQKPVSPADLQRTVSRAVLRAETLRRLASRADAGEPLDDLQQVADLAGQLVKQIREMQVSPPRAPIAMREVPGTQSDERQLTLRFIWQLQETRREVFQGSTLSESSWEILTELMSLELSGRRTSVSGLCLAAKCPVTTALRRIDELTDLGLILKEPDSNDARRMYVRMTELGHQKMEMFLSRVAQGLGRQ